MTYLSLLPFVLTGLLIIMAIDTLGAIASRKLKFRCGYLSILSLSLYISVGFFISKKFSLETALVANILLGVFDGTDGYRLALSLKPNVKQSSEKLQQTVGLTSAVFMAILSSVCTIIGYACNFID